MGNKSKVRASKEGKPNRRKIRFSFEYFQLDHPKFLVGKCQKEFFESLFRQICDYQTRLTVDEFREISNDDHRHPITFSETTEREGFPDINPEEDERVWTDEPWQFGLPQCNGNQQYGGWRVHGFVAENDFYIVWLDPDHALDPCGPLRSCSLESEA